MEAVALAGVIGAVLLMVHWLYMKNQARLRRELEARVHSRDERLKIIDAELRKVHAAVTELLEPPDLTSMTARDAERMRALKALYRAGDMACGRFGWPNPPDA